MDRGQYDNRFEAANCCVLIPTYNNQHALRQVIEDVLRYTSHLIIVNDGSTDGTVEVLRPYEDRAHIVSYTKNQGKGFALRTGFKTAVAKGYRYAITIDSDGQHKASDLPAFLDKLEEIGQDCLIVGARNMGQENVPGTSSFGHRFSNFWYHVETGIKLPDTQSGYRLYPVDALKDIQFYLFTTKYEFEIEVLVRAAWRDMPVVAVPINVYYPPQEQRVTHFRKIPDFTRISLLNTILVFWAFLYVKPFSFFRDMRRKSLRQFFDTYILNSDESNIKIASAIAFGLFVGVAPIWGYQIAFGITMAHLMRLNKVLVVVSSHISIPPMIPFIIYGSFLMGGLFVEGAAQEVSFSSQLSLEVIKSNLLQYVVGSLSLGLLLAVLAGPLSFILLNIFRKKKPAADSRPSA